MNGVVNTAPATDPAPDISRPWWMTVLAALSGLTLVVSVIRDTVIPASRDVEVWFGFEVTGTLALATAPLHWIIFAVGAWGFWNARAWAAPCAAGYLFYAALAHLVWSEASANGRGWPVGLAQAVVIAGFGLLILREHRAMALRS